MSVVLLFFSPSTYSPSYCLIKYKRLMSKEKKSKKCTTSRRILWYAFGAAGLGARGLAALALLVIAIKMSPLKYQAKFFNSCVEELRNSGKSVSASVNFCNGGT